ncbi:bifunctional nuclease family protein [Collinsella stercoris]|uniref:bifunctional nuclease family protein n=1 Tax=Collinsella stercoris TaxID=147206 RepID=UPI00399148E5
MIRVDIESIVMASGPMPSAIVLRERASKAAADVPLRALSIPTGAYEAAAIGHGVHAERATERPIAHDLLMSAVRELGGKVERVEINRFDAPVFYADVVLERGTTAREAEDGNCGDDQVHEIRLDARPSDAIALATRSNAPIYVEDDVMNRAGSVSGAGASKNDFSQEELERFDQFVQNLSPDDF